MATETYTARIMQQKFIPTSGAVTFDDREEAVRFAKVRMWDEVIRDSDSEKIWVLSQSEKRERNAKISHGLKKMAKRKACGDRNGKRKNFGA